jgi:hypothetical protein
MIFNSSSHLQLCACFKGPQHYRYVAHMMHPTYYYIGALLLTADPLRVWTVEPRFDVLGFKVFPL